MVVNIWLYGVPITGAGRLPGATASDGALTVRVYVRVVANGAPVPVLLSVLCTVKVKDPATVGVPLRTPVAPSDKPVGSAPELIE